MPPKKKEVEVVEQVIEDPAVLAAKAERERIQGEERKVAEKNELIDRRRVEAMEQVSWRCVLQEREKRFDPAGWSAKVAFKGPSRVFVKPLSGNRGIPQQILSVPIAADTTVLLLKNAIRDEAVKAGNHPALFAPERQKLHFLTKEVVVPDEYNCAISTLGINAGSTVHVALDAASNLKDLVPSQLHN